MFGSRTNEDGREITADGKSPILTGERVEGNVLVSVKLDKTKNGTECINFEFRQTNGATFTASFYNPKQNEYFNQNLTNLKSAMLHIATKMGVTEEQFWGAVQNITSFEEYANTLINSIFVKGINKKFNLKIVYSNKKDTDEWYAGFPKFPNFIEAEGTNPSILSTDIKYDIYERPKAPKSSTEALEVNSPTGNNPKADLF